MVEAAVVPAAGQGLRMRPLTAAVPKEMLPFGRHPLVEHTVAELEASGCSDICVVIRPGKELIRDYLESRAECYPAAKISFARQERPLGLGDALRCARDFIGGRPFLMAIPDQQLISGRPASRQLLEAAAGTPGVWSSMVDIPGEEIPFFAGARPLRCREDAPGRLIVEEVAPDAESPRRGFGRTIFPPGSLDFMTGAYRNEQSGEVDLLASFAAFGKRFPLYAAVLDGVPCDLGSWEGYLYYQARHGGAVSGLTPSRGEGTGPR